MANHKSALKRIRQNAKRRAHNRHYRSTMRTEIKKLLTAIDAGDAEAAKAQLPNTVSIIQRVAQKGIIHRRQAARRVSRLSGKVNAISA
jgi:small subunit ribosomal protein S20